MAHHDGYPYERGQQMVPGAVIPLPAKEPPLPPPVSGGSSHACPGCGGLNPGWTLCSRHGACRNQTLSCNFLPTILCTCQRSSVSKQREGNQPTQVRNDNTTQYTYYNGIRCVEVDSCTCAGGGEWPHEPHCGLEPVPDDERPTFEDWFAAFAVLTSERGDCRRRKVGAVIVKDRRVIMMGYNGTYPGQPGCLEGACPRGQKSLEEVPPGTQYDHGPGACISIHAELNAILQAAKEGIAVNGATMYVSYEPCETCARLVKQAGIVDIVHPKETP